MKTRTLPLLVTFAVLSYSSAVLAQFSQQGPKLVGTGGVGGGSQGYSVDVSDDGNTAIVGAAFDSSSTGAAWIWTRSGGVWTQQGPKLVGSGTGSLRGCSVAISADGNTAIVGGYSGGGAWVWTRTEGVWTQQGPKLVATPSGGSQGFSVDLSADGNTAIIGAPGSAGQGGAFVWTRSGGVWTQQGAKLSGSGAVFSGGVFPTSSQGDSVALSADGNTAIVGGPTDDSSTGAVWIFTRTAGVWTQQGAKLVGTPPSTGAEQGRSVSLSADGNTAVVGGIFDVGQGAAWIWTRSGGVWTQQGAKLVGSGVSGTTAQQGASVSISDDGNKAIVGGPFDNGGLGACWVWTRSGSVWTQEGAKLVGTGATGDSSQGGAVALSADGNTAIVGGGADNSYAGAAWVFVTPSSDMTVAKSHTTNFRQGDIGDTYTITVTNSGSATSSGTVTVTDVLPAGLTPTAPDGTFNGWSCSIDGQTLTCTRSNALAAGASYPIIVLTLNVANDAPSNVTNIATVAGGAEVNTANNTASDETPISPGTIPATPSGVAATAVTATRIDIAWNAAAGAVSYEIDRRSAGGDFAQIGTSMTNSYSDTTVSANTAHLYRVRAVNGAGPSSSSGSDLATTVIFADEPLVAGATKIRAVHLTQLRTAVNAVRILAGAGAGTYSDPSPTSLPVKQNHLTELRTAIDGGRGPLGLTVGGYTDAAPTTVKAIHFMELRDRVK